MLAIFETAAGQRFALHFEVKQPTDKFSKHKEQAANYALRAACWARSAPVRVLPHTDTATVLLCSSAKLPEYAPHLEKFGSVITFEAIREAFPQATVNVRKETATDEKAQLNADGLDSAISDAGSMWRQSGTALSAAQFNAIALEYGIGGKALRLHFDRRYPGGKIGALCLQRQKIENVSWPRN
ncbi:hypothetical protein N8D56_25715 (plasmid) [Devosia sp. A8/3-2]|nr:hypothetical protein N8D56_25715 [Devosia sp. A8/3-2]